MQLLEESAMSAYMPSCLPARPAYNSCWTFFVCVSYILYTGIDQAVNAGVHLSQLAAAAAKARGKPDAYGCAEMMTIRATKRAICFICVQRLSLVLSCLCAGAVTDLVTFTIYIHHERRRIFDKLIGTRFYGVAIRVPRDQT